MEYDKRGFEPMTVEQLRSYLITENQMTDEAAMQLAKLIQIFSKFACKKRTHRIKTEIKVIRGY